MIVFLLKLTLAHLLGDFLFQPAKWVADKAAHKGASAYLYWHILVHFLLLSILLSFNFQAYWLGILIITVSHYIIDLIKTLLTDKINKRYLFFADQAAHALVILIVLNIYFPYTWTLATLLQGPALLLISCVLFVTVVSATIMKVLISRWDITEWLSQEEGTMHGLEKAGAYIGIIERLFVFCFIILNHWEGVGFLLAAKSIFRFGDLTKTKDRKLTEYILIGTLLSFGLAIFTGIIYWYGKSALQQVLN